MPWYRIGNPGEDVVAHINFGRKKSTPATCVAQRLPGDKPDWGEKCGRMSAAVCDAPAGQDLAGKPLTCDAPMCELHRTHVEGKDIDYCQRHRSLAPAPLDLTR